MSSRRNRLVPLLLLAALGSFLPLVAGAASAGAAPTCAGPTATTWVVWTGASGDASWDTPGNWVDGVGAHRVPTSADTACIDASAGPVVAADGLRASSVTVLGTSAAPALVLSGEVEATAIYSAAPIRASGVVQVRTGKFEVARLDVASGANVTLDVPLQSPTAVPVDVVVDGSLVLRRGGRIGSILVGPAGGFGTTRLGTDAPAELSFAGAIDVRHGGHLVVAHRTRLSFAPTATLVGEAPELFDLDLVVAPTFPVTVRGDVGLTEVRAGQTVTVRPEGDRMSLREPHGYRTILNQGTLDVRGAPGDPVVGKLPQGTVESELLNTGSMVLEGVTLHQFLSNGYHGTLRVSRFVFLSSATTGGVLNDGRIEVGARLGATDSPIAASLVVSHGIINRGTMVATDPTAEVTTDGYTGPGTSTVRTNVVAADASHTGTIDPAGPEPLLFGDLAWGGNDVALGVRGLAAPDADRVRVAGVLYDFGATRGFAVTPATGYVPCAGARWQLLSRAKGLVGYRPAGSPITGNRPEVRPPTTDVHLTGVPAGVTADLVERPDGYVAIVTGSPTDGAACSDPAGRRIVSGLFVDGLGRPATAAQLGDFGGRAATAAGRKGAARELLGGEAATRRFVDAEVRRILGRPASAASLRSYDRRIRAGLDPDAMRAEVYGDAGFYANSGSTVDRWAQALYRTELGRPITTAEVLRVRSQVKAKVSRRAIAASLLAGVEADRALAGRSIELWWARPSTTAERATWGARYQSGSERTATADLAAANPIG